ncbi:YihY/virulence factor BrkB family protein [Thiolinea disciformis]|uniref:YihY/virulence factor BrkB family protein n=1 Tax=Thiolinea disciformis TaxID=125614 RepID=UPI001FE1A231|nr:YihY/virulence factor BrkB family protein [Thiolinea disciformis]
MAANTPLASLLSYIRLLPAALYHELMQGPTWRHAKGLSYSTLLSMVPLLALSFSILKSFGVHKQLEPLIYNFMSPLGSMANPFTQQILSFVDNVQVGVLGTAGLLTLFYTVLTLMQSVEVAFNDVWRVHKPRNMLTQIRDYLSVVLIGPVFLVSMFGLWHSINDLHAIQNMTRHEPFGQAISFLLRYMPFFTTVIAFTFLYLFMPNTHVKFSAALSGAIVGALCWQFAAKVFSSFVVGSGQQIAIYSIFASLFLFMLWLYVGWMIVLIGARLTYYLQYPGALQLAGQPTQTSLQTREILAAVLVRDIAQRFLTGQAPATLDDLCLTLPVPVMLVEDSLNDLISYGVLSRDDQDPAHYLMRISPAQLTVADLRRFFWQGDYAQQKQATQLIKQAGLEKEWLQELVANQQQTVQQLLSAKQALSHQTQAPTLPDYPTN